MPDTNEALTAIESQEKLLHELLYTLRGLRRKLYMHRRMPTTVDGKTTTMMHTCMICHHNALGECEIVHQRNCPLERVNQAWRAAKEAMPELFDFSDKYTKNEPEVQAPVEVAPETPATISDDDMPF